MAAAKRNYTPKDPQVVNLMNLFESFGSEELCREYLEQLRWPDGLRCPRCDAAKGISRVKGRGYECESCGYKYSVLAGTIFHDTKLPLVKWFAATYLMCESRKGISANQMKRTLGVSYKTAWYLCHRIRAAMGSVVQRPLEGVIELDETYVGGSTGRHGRRGPQADKVIVAGAIERDGEIRLRVVNDVRRHTLKKFVTENVDLEHAEAVYSDKLASYIGIHPNHDSVNHNEEEWVRGDVHTQTVEGIWSLLKRSIVGSYHQLSARHLPAYLDEMEWRFNNRDNPYLFRDTMDALIHSETLTYQELIQ
jgi:transposase-like protein